MDDLLAAVAAEADSARDERFVEVVDAALKVHSKATVARVLNIAVSNLTQRLERTRARVKVRRASTSDPTSWVDVTHHATPNQEET